MQAINEFWFYIVGNDSSFLNDLWGGLEKNVFINELKTKELLKSNLIFDKYIDNNSSFVNSNYVIEKISDYYLLGMLREEETFEPCEYIIKFPKNLGIDYEEYWNSSDIEEIENIDIEMADDSLYKFHLNLQEAKDMYFENLAVSEKSNGGSIIFNFK